MLEADRLCPPGEEPQNQAELGRGRQGAEPGAEGMRVLREESGQQGELGSESGQEAPLPQSLERTQVPQKGGPHRGCEALSLYNTSFCLVGFHFCSVIFLRGCVFQETETQIVSPCKSVFFLERNLMKLHLRALQAPKGDFFKSPILQCEPFLQHSLVPLTCQEQCKCHHRAPLDLHDLIRIFHTPLPMWCARYIEAFFFLSNSPSSRASHAMLPDDCGRPSPSRPR